MTNEILTPISVWSNLVINEVPTAQTIGEYKEGAVTIERMRIDGNTCPDGQVKIYAVLARNKKKESQPAIFIVQKFTDGADETLAMDLARKGFVAFVVNVGGDDGVNTNFTLYPESVSYANYKNAKDLLDQAISGDVTKTCWYQWGTTVRYALEYLRSLPFVTKIGGLGISDSATVLWHMTATVDFDALAFIMNAGWRAYKGNFKFSGKVDEDFSDEKIRYLAAIEPQSYAQHIKAPTLIETATNSPDFDYERAHDTFARITSKVYSAINNTVGAISCVDYQAYQNVCQFFKTALSSKSSVDNLSLPDNPLIKCEEDDRKLTVTVSPDLKKLKSVSVFVSEGQLNPALRQWKKLTEYNEKEQSFVFEYLPSSKSEIAFCFAKVEYKNGFTVCSDTLSKKIEKTQSSTFYKSKVVYSSREENAESVFSPVDKSTKKPSGIELTDENGVFVKDGAMDIQGVTSKGGLLSFGIGLEQNRPKEDGILLLDAYVKDGGEIVVKLIADYFGDKKEYYAYATVPGGEVWHNLKFSVNNFKTQEGMTIRSIDKIQAIEISSKSEYLINNVLWV